MIKSQKITNKQIWAYLLNVVKPFPVSLFVMFLVAIFFASDISIKPYLLKIILNRLTQTSSADVIANLTAPILSYLGMSLLLTTLFRFYGYFVDVQMIPQLRKKIADDALGKLVDQDHNYHQNNFSGSLTNKINDLTSSVPDIVQIIIDRFFSHTLALIVAITTLWFVNALFALVMLAWTMLFLAGALILSKRITILASNWAEYGSIITGKLVDVFSNILSVRLFTAKLQEKKSLSQTFTDTVAAEQKMQWVYFWMWTFNGYAYVILLGLTFYFLCKGYQEGGITIGDFALVLGINISIIDFLYTIAKEFSQFSKLYGRIAQALQAILNQPELTDKLDALELNVRKGSICFDQVKFHYKGTKALFENKSVTIESGQKVGLVGYSGGGKSTFVNLILRLYDVTSGKILIDGQDIQEVTQESLRRNIAMILQDPSLFHRSLMDNIRYGRADADDAEVIDAAKRAHAHEFIIKLQQGYNSLVGERGVKLSGGQRQRIVIARAILKNASILILDEQPLS